MGFPTDMTPLSHSSPPLRPSCMYVKSEYCAEHVWCLKQSLLFTEKERDGEMLLLLYGGYTHLSAPLWLTTQNIFNTQLWCNCWVCVCVSLCVWACACEREWNEEWTSSQNIFTECIIQDSIREYRWNYYDWEIHLFFILMKSHTHVSDFDWLNQVSMASVYLWVQDVYCFQRFSMKCKYKFTSRYDIMCCTLHFFFFLVRHDVHSDCLSTVSRYRFLMRGCFFNLFFFRSILDGSQSWNINTHFNIRVSFTFERRLVFSFYCVS